MTRAYLGLGSNMGDRIEHLRGGVAALVSAEDVLVIGVSGVYHSEPVGVTDQPEFLNAVVAVETSLGPRELLALAQGIEARRGRKRVFRWGPRTLDVDILLYGDSEVAEHDLTIPHPRLKERRFVLEPLLEVAPGAALPDGASLNELRESLENDQLVWRDRDLVIGT